LSRLIQGARVVGYLAFKVGAAYAATWNNESR
jgi:hypothetical protein